MLDKGTPVPCSSEKWGAYDLYKDTDVWADVPADSPTQEECDINVYMDHVINKQGGGGSGTF